MFVNWIKICPDLHKLASDLYLIYKLSPSARVCISDTDRLLMFYLVHIELRSFLYRPSRKGEGLYKKTYFDCRCQLINSIALPYMHMNEFC
jgi:hypothetical protein